MPDLVGVFDAEQSAAFLRERLTQHPELLVGARDLAEALDYSPLALSQATAFMLNRKATAEQYLSLFWQRERTTGRLDRVPDDHAIAMTRLIVVELADRLTQGVAPALLSLAAVLHPTEIPSAVLKSEAVRAHLCARLRFEVHTGAVQDGLALLRRLGLAAVGERHATTSVPHPVRRLTMDDLTDDDLALITWAAADGVLEVWSAAADAIDVDLMHSLRTNVDALLETSGARLLDDAWGVHPVVPRIGRDLALLGIATEAVHYMRRVVTEAVRVLGEEHPHTLVLRGAAASAQGYVKDAAGALDEFDILVDDCERLLGGQHKTTVDNRASRASYLARTGRIQDAVHELREVLAMRTCLLGWFHKDTLTTRARLAVWQARLAGTGEPGKTTAELAEVLNAFREHHPGEVRAIHLTRASLANWRGQGGDPAGAAADLADLLADSAELSGEDHPGTLTVLHDLAQWYAEAGDSASAGAARQKLDSAHRRVEKKCERVFGRRHPDTLAWRKIRLAKSLPRKVTAAYAVELAELARDEDAVFGTTHSRTVATTLRAASALGRTGEPDEAVNLLESLLSAVSQQIDIQPSTPARIRAGLAHWQGKAGRPADAARTLQVLLRSQSAAPVTNPEHIRTTLANLAAHQQAAGNPIGFGMALTAQLAREISDLGAESAEVLATRFQLAVWRVRSGKRTDLLHEVRRLADQHAERYGVADPATLQACFQYAASLYDAGEVDKAVRALKRVIRDQRAQEAGTRARRTTFYEGVLKKWLTSSRRPNRATTPRWPDPGLRHRDDALADLDLAEVGPVEETTARLLATSEAAPALLESLALAFDGGLPRTGGTWLAVASALSTTAITDEDIEALLAAAGPLITVDATSTPPAHRLAHPRLDRQVLAVAAARLGIDPEVDARLRHRRIADELVARFRDIPYLVRNTARHAGAGRNLITMVTDDATLLDRIDLDTLTEEVLRSLYGGPPLPAPLAVAMQTLHLLKGRSSGDRAVVRALFTPTRRGGTQATIPGAVWTPVWSTSKRDQDHVVLSGVSGAMSRSGGFGYNVLATVAADLSDGTRLIAVGRRGGEVSLVNAGTGVEVLSTITSDGELVELAVVPAAEHPLLAVVGKRGVCCWDLVTGLSDEGRRITFDDECTAAVVFRRADRTPALALAMGNRIAVWDPGTGAVVDLSTARHNGTITALCPFPSERRPSDSLAVAGGSGVVTLWESDPIRLSDQVLGVPGSPVLAMSVVPVEDGTALWVGHGDGTAVVWDPHVGQPRTDQPVLTGHDQVIALAPVRPAGNRVVMATAGSDHTVRFWNPGTGAAEFVPLTGHTASVRTLTAVRLDDDHETLVSGGDDGTVRLWREVDVQPQDGSSRPRHAVVALTSVRNGRNGRRALVKGYLDDGMRLLAEQAGEPEEQIKSRDLEARLLTTIPCEPGGELVAAVRGTDLLIVWDPSEPVTYGGATRIGAEARVTALAALRLGDGTPVVAAGDENGAVHLWNPRNRTVIQSTQAHSGPVRAITCLGSGTAAGKLITGGDDRMIAFWDLDTGAQDGPPLTAAESVTALALVPGTRAPVLASTGDETRGKIRLYDPSTRRELPHRSLSHPVGRVTGLAHVATETGHPLLVGTSQGGTVHLWDCESDGQELHRLDVGCELLAAHAFGSSLALSTKRGVHLFSLTLDRRLGATEKK